MLRRYTLARSPVPTEKEISRLLAGLRRRVARELDRDEGPSLLSCKFCPNRDVHRVHFKLFQFEKLLRSSHPQDLWSGRILQIADRSGSRLTKGEASDLTKAMRQEVKEELDRQAQM